MKKILILTNLDIGLYKFRKELIRELLHRNCRVYLSLPDGDLIRPLEKMGCIFINTDLDRRGMNPKTDGNLLKQYQNILKKIRPDLVITYTIKPNIYGGLLCRMTKTPYVTMITGLGTAFQKKGPLKQLVTFLYKRSLKKADKVFFENKENCRIFLKSHIVKRKEAVVLPGAGVNLKEYPFSAYPSETAGIRFLFIGRIMKEKGIDELFAAAKIIKEKYPTTKFDIVGPYEDNYKETIEQLAAEGILTYYGYQDDVQPYIRQAHCFVLPSYHEGMANTLLECAAMGRPLITSDIPGCREAVQMEEKTEKDKSVHWQERVGMNGILCEAQNVESLIQAMENFLKMGEEAHQEMGKCSRAWMEKRFDKRKVVGRTVRELEI